MCGSAVCVPVCVSVHVCVRVLFVCYGGGGVTACFWRGLVPFSSLAGWHAPGADGTDWEHEHCHVLGRDRNSLFPLSSPDSIFDSPPPSYLLFSCLLFFSPPFLFTPVCNCFQKKKIIWHFTAVNMLIENLMCPMLCLEFVCFSVLLLSR